MMLEKQLFEDVKKDRIAHAYLFVGGSRDERMAAARYLFSLIKENKNGVEADYREFLDDGEELKKEQLLEITRLASQTGQGYGNFFVIESVDRMNDSSSNVFLKTLEEPPGKTCFVLMTGFIDRVPATIISRCRVVNLGNTDLEAAVSILKGKFPFLEENQVMEAAAFYNGAIGLASELLESEEKTLAFERFKDFSEKLLKGMNVAERILFVQEVKGAGQSSELLRVMLFVVRRELVKFALSSGKNSDLGLKLAGYVEAIIEADGSIAKNVNEALVLDNLMLIFD